MKNSLKIIIPIIIAIVSIVIAISMLFTVTVVGVIALPWTTMAIYYNFFVEDPPAPSVTYGEFPFEIVYEIGDETVVVNDVFICEFAGYGANEGTGKYRKWKGYVKSTGEEDLMIIEDGNLELRCSLGNPKYYMGEPDYPQQAVVEPTIYYEKREGFWFSSGVLDIEPLMEQYKLKLISWKLSEPIENTFE